MEFIVSLDREFHKEVVYMVQRSKNKDLCKEKRLRAQVGVNFDLVICFSIVQKCLLGNVIACRGFYTAVQVWHVSCVPGVVGHREIVVTFPSSHPSVL